MNTFTKSVVTFLAASSITSVALAAPGDATYGQSTRGQIHSLESQAKEVNVSLEDNAAFAPTIKASQENSHRAEFLQNKLN
ncbi:hypothetical protein [Marinomonas pollencensis]|uniref:DUF4148 domain-containing protein n=1 Tax=Marinomonas pollencensis TaxID=491954 RepID=A0A3E0DUE4_9GAMM|nr:hypothetical protein [Marinomonas pollencensis]REG85118.1 hypothetical protein DFP81_103318 [Marinomonas pollencensis]